MDEQLTFRIPRGLARALNRAARSRGVPRSLVVREALAGYLAETAGDRSGPASEGPASAAPDPWARVRRFVGAAPLDGAAEEADELTRLIRAHNWRS